MTQNLPTDLDALARDFAAIAIRAGRIIMKLYCSGLDVQSKCDGSPVTAADALAEKSVIADLRTLLPGIQIVAEEACASRLETTVENDFILVDALDGTAEFVARRPEFTVNIALVSGGEPIAGCVFSPASGEIYIGGKTAACGKVGKGCDDMPDASPIHARTRRDPAIATISRSHLDQATLDFLERHRIDETIKVGSSIKFCRIAEGRADVYPRFGRTMEWDTAAGHAVLKAAGGDVLTLEGERLRYGKVGQAFANGAFVARGR